MVQFRRSKKFGPFRFTLSQKGISASAGAGPLRISRGADGKVRRTVKVPGTGIYDVKVVGHNQPRAGARQKGATTMSKPPAGWYADPSGTPRQRYWDGEQWTTSYDPPADEGPATPPPPNPAADEPSAWSSLLEFSGVDVPASFRVTRNLNEAVKELLADPTNHAADNPLLGALASAIFELEAKVLINLMNLSTEISVLKRAHFSLEQRIVESGSPAAPMESDLDARLGEMLRIDWD